MRLDILGRIGVLLQLFAERRHKDAQRGNVVIPTTTTASALIRSTVIAHPMRWRNLITSVIQAVEKKFNRTAAVGFVGIL